MSNILLTPFSKGDFKLKNRVVMAPMTRSRAEEKNTPNSLMAEYYGQRAGAGLIITEGTSPSPNGLGYARIPAIYNEAHITGWRLTTEAVHEKGAKIFIQLMHTGRVSHQLNMPEGAEILAPSAVASKGEMYTDQEGMKPLPVPRAMTTEEVQKAIQEHVTAAKNAIKAGFDGVEIHAANGYLLEQFLNPEVNNRTDKYGGSIENRARFVLEITEAVAEAIGKEKTGIRVSPYGTFGDMPVYDETDETYRYLAKELNKQGILYIHIVDHSSMGTPEVPLSIKKDIREAFSNILILSGGYTQERAVEDLEKGLGDLVAFGRPYIANPDLTGRFESGAALAEPDQDTFYAGGEKGYIDYPALQDQEA